ncbi:Holliday junction DNA helicase subunit RuvA [Streptoalloteichus tenebrarius]|uniref:Holliday junction branch migration complex subunit RuvA n=1 Tax=Streptoalloteichus tenebrarius (strain ATCC 17920 / DSM 40477 / JCM 4838 / CBS 697.72 / NBRC 16177 / NCIMB 11028 / NRRL B-12390 / A12253. 1 / ISP 5477) TaxID=1933 RepID=A0ABT1HS90_STRSD|nr:Holliday junction branch migration protein RuvA [Streptoalloteichus tenebrarius]MCP2258384.1 Holliday junction DNA helicase subunit RuvA [Streptoalloteichus tenebrarius]BFF03551.1 Holliday junction branch migration protein RuvA [Streptoalloteichus tenebrarius]
MIASVRGPVLSVGLDHAVVEVGGVGLAVHATPSTLATLRRGEEAALATALVVREDSLTLYGFADAEARDLFGLLQTVTGVGPRLALATLAVLEPDKLRHAISDGNITILTQVPGIGRKGAERLVIELRDKIGAFANVGTDGASSAVDTRRVRAEVCEALVGLGFSAKQAEQTVDAVLAETDGAPAATETSSVLRRALVVLGRKK